MSLKGIHIFNPVDILNPVNKSIHLFQLFVNVDIADNFTHLYKNVFEYTKNHNIKIVIHSSYSINIARRFTPRDWWVEHMINEIKICDKINGFALVVHTGKQLDLSDAESTNNMYTLLLYVHKMTSKLENVKILLETPSGQGTEKFTILEEFCRFMNKFYTHPDDAIKERFGVCVDTCHIFSAGYDISKTETMDKYFNNFNELIGIDKIKLCHLNDSKGKLGDKLDRHANIDDGHIGLDGILRLVKFMKTLGIPIILETPGDKIYEDFLTIEHI